MLSLNSASSELLNDTAVIDRVLAKIQAPGQTPAEICSKSAGVLQNFFSKMYIIILENEGFWAVKVTIFQIFRLKRAKFV